MLEVIPGARWLACTARWLAGTLRSAAATIERLAVAFEGEDAGGALAREADELAPLGGTRERIGLALERARSHYVVAVKPPGTDRSPR